MTTMMDAMITFEQEKQKNISKFNRMKDLLMVLNEHNIPSPLSVIEHSISWDTCALHCNDVGFTINLHSRTSVNGLSIKTSQKLDAVSRESAIEGIKMLVNHLKNTK